ncbi:GNAT family N-acyltransferase [Solwaraspora sp. WMMD406]|uniref:GNAT family N-acetyltransferase n=1 Tax=Solwaraspora sp. WMMD406 TaxID=3016095 RepID=UPI0024163328|nr:GNAT family N-acyltransferase [Solwaraspora sp. WMMD406]MDG4767607.1 GNAT family N-acyltransferase [Solwaraspora sp. WMMD406]
MAVLLTAAAPSRTSGYTVSLAEDADQVAAAQRLRHQVFAGELGARLTGGDPNRDVDEFDDHCDHLIVRHELSGAVVGTYRLLPPARVARLGRRYADAEFDTRPLRLLDEHLVEAGRSCVHPDHRTGAVINLIWTGIARYLRQRGLRWLGGCASVPLHDGGATALAVWQQVRTDHLAPPLLRLRPRRPWLAELDSATVAAPAGRTAMPPLLRGYLRLGGWVCGEPAYDPEFATADFYVLLSLDRMDPRYLRHFLETSR